MATKWQSYAKKQKEKRTGKKAGGENTREESVPVELVVQRMSSEVSGKQQKYEKIGAREYVPFTGYEEFNVPNIVHACSRFFAGDVEQGTVCDVLAGERGPSCRRMDQIPDKKVFYVRFIKKEMEDDELLFDHEHEQKKARMEQTSTKAKSLPSPQKLKSKCYPKSLSVMDMLKLGKPINATSATLIDIKRFDFDHMQWSVSHHEAEFNIDVLPFETGGFRNAFKATSISPGFTNKAWVVKKYLPKTLSDIKESNQTVKDHSMKSVQAHFLARNFAMQLKEEVELKLLKYGDTFHYKQVFWGETQTGDYVTIEEFIPGDFIKYINNNGDICVEEDTPMLRKVESLVHYSYVKSNKNLMVLDIQGSGYTLYDPEIASVDAFDANGEFQFCAGNLAKNAMENFMAGHKCSKFCIMLNLNLAK